jgi:hypothetical protein
MREHPASAIAATMVRTALWGFMLLGTSNETRRASSAQRNGFY